ncbi:MAG: hypothetical protein ACYTFA_12855 [Planctomycetota bacterium]
MSHEPLLACGRLCVFAPEAYGDDPARGRGNAFVRSALKLLEIGRPGDGKECTVVPRFNGLHRGTGHAFFVAYPKGHADGFTGARQDEFSLLVRYAR